MIAAVRQSDRPCAGNDHEQLCHANSRDNEVAYSPAASDAREPHNILSRPDRGNNRMSTELGPVYRPHTSSARYVLAGLFAVFRLAGTGAPSGPLPGRQPRHLVAGRPDTLRVESLPRTFRAEIPGGWLGRSLVTASIRAGARWVAVLRSQTPPLVRVRMIRPHQACMR